MIKGGFWEDRKNEKEKRSKKAFGGLKREIIRRGIVVNEQFSFR